MKRVNGYLKAGLLLTGFLTLLIVAGYFWTPYDPSAMMAGPKLSGPTLHNLMGTDNFGRDIFSRVLKGAGTTFAIAAAGGASSVCWAPAINTMWYWPWVWCLSPASPGSPGRPSRPSGM